jgi:hypothetical protein
MKTLACLVLLLQRINCDRKAILADFARQTRIRALKMALIVAMVTVLAQGAVAATITVHPPDSDDRVFVDVVWRSHVCQCVCTHFGLLDGHEPLGILHR